MTAAKPSGYTIDTLKEYLEAKIEHVTATGKKDAEIVQVYIRAQDEARKLQAVEYERRLTGLNGEQERIAKSQVTYVSREVWDQSQKEQQKFNAEVKEFTAQHAGQRQGVGLSSTIIDRIVTLVIGVALAYAAFRALK